MRPDFGETTRVWVNQPYFIFRSRQRVHPAATGVRDASSNRRRSQRFRPAGRHRSMTPVTTARAWPPHPSASRRASSSRHPCRVSPTPRSLRRSVSRARHAASASPRVARFGDARETRQRVVIREIKRISTAAPWLLGNADPRPRAFLRERKNSHYRLRR